MQVGQKRKQEMCQLVAEFGSHRVNPGQGKEGFHCPFCSGPSDKPVGKARMGQINFISHVCT